MSAIESYQEQMRQERRERLRDFLTKSPEWNDFKAEILDPIFDNADSMVHTVNCDNREIYVGKCAALQEIYDAVDEIKSMEVKKVES